MARTIQDDYWGNPPGGSVGAIQQPLIPKNQGNVASIPALIQVPQDAGAAMQGQPQQLPPQYQQPAPQYRPPTPQQRYQTMNAVNMDGDGTQYLPIPVTTIADAASVTLTLTPQRPIQVSRLVLVTPDVGFILTDFRVGATPQGVQTGAVPVEIFAPGAFGVGLRGDWAYPGTTISLSFTNNSGASGTVGGAIIGPTQGG